MNHRLTFLLASLCIAGAASAQTPAPSSQPSPKATTPAEEAPPPPKTAPNSSNPEDSHTATTGDADKQAFPAGKKRDSSAGCSTPTDARNAGVDTSKDSPNLKRSDNTRTVCTTAGAESVGASEKPKQRQPPKEASAPQSSSSAKPR